jgi:tetratricopeptide (TPR) repeat protein
MRSILLLIVVTSIASCTSVPTPLNCNDERDLVLQKETEFTESGFEDELLHDLMRTYAEFANACSSDSITPEFLFRRADLLRGDGQIRESIRLFKAVHDGYPQYPKRPVCVFLVAFLYETELNDKVMAEKYYLQVIELYPNSDVARSAKITLQYLGETPAELLKRIQEKNS